MQPVLCTNLYGQKVWVSQTSAGAFRRHGGFDVPTLALIEYLASCFPQAVAFDIGANIGNHTVVLGKFCKQVVAFEPRLAIEEYLRENVVQNGLTNCELVAAGLSDSEGTAKLFLSASAEGGTSTFVRELSDAAGGDVEVPIQIGDHFVERVKLAQLDIVKLDVEGMEATVVLGLSATIAKFAPVFLMEWNNDVTRNTFAKHKLFTTVFVDYVCVGARDPSARELFPKTLGGKINQKIARLQNKKDFVLVPFAEAENFETLLLVPRTKVVKIPRLARFFGSAAER